MAGYKHLLLQPCELTFSEFNGDFRLVDCHFSTGQQAIRFLRRASAPSMIEFVFDDGTVLDNGEAQKFALSAPG